MSYISKSKIGTPVCCLRVHNLAQNKSLFSSVWGAVSAFSRNLTLRFFWKQSKALDREPGELDHILSIWLPPFFCLPKCEPGNDKSWGWGPLSLPLFQQALLSNQERRVQPGQSLPFTGWAHWSIPGLAFSQPLSPQQVLGTVLPASSGEDRELGTEVTWFCFLTVPQSFQGQPNVAE